MQFGGLAQAHLLEVSNIMMLKNRDDLPCAWDFTWVLCMDRQLNRRKLSAKDVTWTFYNSFVAQAPKILSHCS